MTFIAAPFFSWPLEPDVVLVPRTALLTDAFHALIDGNREHLARWEPWPLDERTAADTRALLEADCRAWSAGALLPTAIAVREREGWRLAGSVVLRIDRTRRMGDLGYWIGAAHEGRGLATLAATAVLAQAFGPLGLDRVVLYVRSDNDRSRAVAHRLGFVEEGLLRASVAFPDRRYDEIAYGLLAKEWADRPAG